MITAPSGAGKTSLVKSLLCEDSSCALSVSYTTRPPRPGEVNGVDYYFVDEPTFLSMIKEQAFLEWARVHDQYYGTAKQDLWRLQAEGKDIILEIDWQGASAVRMTFPKDCAPFTGDVARAPFGSRQRLHGSDRKKSGYRQRRTRSLCRI